MIINLFGILILSSQIIYLKPISPGCEIVTSERHVEYTTGMSCEAIGNVINEELRKEHEKI